MKIPAKAKLALGICVFSMSAYFGHTVEADTGKIVLKDYPTIVACYNQSTGEFVAPRNESVEDGGCMI
jgi:hypothetical protein